MRKIVLCGKYGKGKFAFVDNEDFQRINKIRWWVNRQGYVESRSAWSLHRFIMNPPIDMIIDHINHNPLDNRKENLRICTQAQNAWNKKISKKKYFTGYRGVTLVGPDRYEAKIKREHLGYFKNKEEAARVWDKRAKEIYGKFAWLNFN